MTVTTATSPSTTTALGTNTIQQQQQPYYYQNRQQHSQQPLRSLVNITISASQYSYPYQYQYQYQQHLHSQQPSSSLLVQPFNQQQQIQQSQKQQIILPIANAGVSKIVGENTIVALDGRASYSPNVGSTIVSYQWIQLLPATTTIEGRVAPVNLIGSNTATPTFTAPTVPIDTILAFSLSVMDNHGDISSNPSMVYIEVKHTGIDSTGGINNNDAGIGNGVSAAITGNGFGISQQQQQRQQQLQIQPFPTTPFHPLPLSP